MVISIILQITCRYFPMAAFIWTEELARLTFIWFCFISIPITYYYKGHMSIDYLVSKLNTKLQSLFYYIGTILISILSLILTYTGIKLTILAKGQMSPMMNLSFSWFYAAVPVGFGLVALFSILSMFVRSTPSNKNELDLTEI